MKDELRFDVSADAIDLDLPQKRLTAAEWRAIVASDPVLQFIESVHAAAAKHPKWREYYAGAYYETFHEQARQHMLSKVGPCLIEME